MRPGYTHEHDAGCDDDGWDHHEPCIVEQPPARLELVPMTITDAKTYVAIVHRHNLPPQSGLFAVGAKAGDELVGVAIVGRPVARMLQDGYAAEVTRLATDGTPNACSMLYGACSRAAKALGYRRIYTYTLQREDGASLRASGWTLDAELDAAPTWSRPSRPRVQVDLFGNERRPSEPKFRWVKHFAARDRVEVQ